MSERYRIVIEEGVARFVYSDALAPLAADGVITRASHVEPAISGGWLADMRPSGGPVLLAEDGFGFPTRQAALDAERAWLLENKGI